MFILCLFLIYQAISLEAFLLLQTNQRHLGFNQLLFSLFNKAVAQPRAALCAAWRSGGACEDSPRSFKILWPRKLMIVALVLMVSLRYKFSNCTKPDRVFKKQKCLQQQRSTQAGWVRLIERLAAAPQSWVLVRGPQIQFGLLAANQPDTWMFAALMSLTSSADCLLPHSITISSADWLINTPSLTCIERSAKKSQRKSNKSNGTRLVPSLSLLPRCCVCLTSWGNCLICPLIFTFHLYLPLLIRAGQNKRKLQFNRFQTWPRNTLCN